MNLFRSALRKPFHIALMSSVAVCTPAWAQPDDDDDEVPISGVADPDAGRNDPNATEGAIIVTGSRIARRDLTSASPLAVVQDEEFTLTGTTNVEQVLNQMPQIIPSTGSTAFGNNPGSGVAALSLRGLGSARNLVLVNGRRWIFYDTNQIVDVNTVPAFLLDSVDVVTGGASAVYGSDALAGVVNFRLRRLDGVVAGAQYNITEEGDGRRYGVHLGLGTELSGGRGHAATYGEYFNRGSIFQGDRAFSRFELAENTARTALIRSGSPTVPQGRIQVPTEVNVGSGTAAVPFPIGAGTDYDATHGGQFFANPGVGRRYLGDPDSYNFAPDNYLMVPQERFLLGGYGEYEVAENINAYAEVTFVNNRVARELAPTPISGNIDIRLSAIQPLVSAADFAQLQQIAARQQAANASAVARGVALPFTNFTVGTTAQTGTPLPATHVRVQANRRVNEGGARNSLDERNAWRTLVGVKGNLTEDLTYDAYYLFARTRNSQIQEGNVSRSAYNRAVAEGQANIFGLNTLTPAMTSLFMITAQNSDTAQLQVGQASVAGPLFEFGWANEPVAFAAGVEWRSMSGRFIPDTALSSGDVVGFNAGNPTAGGYSVREVFGELRIPIIQDGFFHRLELNGAARYSDYSLEAVGGVWTYAAGAEFAPIRDVTFRGQYQRAVRAPNVAELFGGQSIGFPAATDPCSSRFPVADRTAAVRATCIATGVPANAVFTAQVQPAAQIEGLFGGNPTLEEEVADTWTAGVVLRPRFVPRLNVTVDYYDIKIDNAISALAGGVQNILTLCYTGVQDPSHPLCQAVRRDPTTGAIASPFTVVALQANLASFETSGVDLQVDYNQPLGFSALGGDESRLNFYFLATWTEKWNQIPVPGLPTVIECRGAFGQRCGQPRPEWAWTSRVSFVDGPMTTSLRWRYIGRVRDDNPTTTFVVEEITPRNYFDLAFAFDVNDNLTLNLGVNNLLDKQPPIMGTNRSQAATWPETYDPLGRDFFISANLRF
jgi:outer membrane receptor protein involved in Fe transport